MVDEADDRPVLVGVIALVGVSLVIGLIVALVALGGTRVVGLAGGGGGGGGGGGPEPTLTLPAVTETDFGATSLTLTPEADASAGDSGTLTGGPEPAETTTTTEAATPEISLQINTTSAGPMERIDVSGIYTGGDGAVLSIQRFTDGTWNDIAANAAVSGELFSTYIALGRPGENRIRAYDASADLASNEVVVTIE